MKFTASYIAEVVRGLLKGNPSLEVNRLVDPGQLASHTVAVLFTNNIPKEIPKDALIVVPEGVSVPQGVNAIEVPNPKLAFARLTKLFYYQKELRGIHETAVVSPSAQISEDSYIGAYSVIGENAKIGSGVRIMDHVVVMDGVEIGDNTIIYPNTVIYTNVAIGKNCIIHSGCVIGSDGFGFVLDEEGRQEKIYHLGRVVIKDNVEIGANTTIDRAVLGETVIDTDVKIDNLVQIAHNVRIGKATVIASQAGIAGSSQVGQYCMIGGQVGIADHITIGDKVAFGAQSGVNRNIRKPGVYLGTPALELHRTLRIWSILQKLPELYKKMLRLLDNQNGAR